MNNLSGQKKVTVLSKLGREVDLMPKKELRVSETIVSPLGAEQVRQKLQSNHDASEVNLDTRTTVK